MAALGATGSAAGAQRSLGEFKAWSAVSYRADGAPVCMMWSAPRSEEGDYQRRGDVYAFVTHRPGEGRRDQVGFEAGYPFRRDSRVEVSIDGAAAFRLSTVGSTAFSAAPAEERRLVAAMRAGRSMVVEGVSSRGTHTRDTYSLFGFGAAHRAIDRGCRR